MTRARVVTVAGQPEAEARFVTALATHSDVEIAFRCVDRVELLAAIRGASPDLIVSVGCPPWLDRQACDEAVGARVPLVGLAAGGVDADAFSALGILVLPLDADPERVLTASADALPQAPAAMTGTLDPRGRVVSVWGPKGAPGRSTLALEIAAELSSGNPKTVLVDADTYGGDLAQLLGVVEELPSIVWAAQTAARGDAVTHRLMPGLRRAGASGPVLIPGITRADLWGDVGEFAWRELLDALARSFDHVVVDVGFCLEDGSGALPAGEGRNALARHAVRESDWVVAVCRCDPVGIKTFLWAYQALIQLVEEDRVAVVANRVGRGEEKTVADILRRHCGKRPLAYLPDDPATVRAAVAKGVAVREVAGSSGLARSVTELTASLGGRPRPSGLFARLAGRA